MIPLNLYFLVYYKNIYLDVRKIRSKRDIDPGSHFEYYTTISHSQCKEICGIISTVGYPAGLIAELLKCSKTAAIVGFLTWIPVHTIEAADHGNGVKVLRLNTNYQIFTLIPA